MAAAVAMSAANQRRRQQEVEQQQQRESNARRITMMEAPPPYPSIKKYGIMVYERFTNKYDYIARSSENKDDIMNALVTIIIGWIKGQIKIPNLLVFCTDKDPDLMNWDILHSLPGDKAQVYYPIKDGYLISVPADAKYPVLIDMGRIISLDSKALTALYKSKGGKWSWFTSDSSKQMFLLRDLVKDFKLRSEIRVT